MSAGEATGRLARSLALTAGLASARFPVTALLVVLFSILANAEVAGQSLVPSGTLGWWIASLYGAAAASLVAKLFLERRGVRPLAAQAVSLLAALLVGGIVRYAALLGVFAPALLVAVTFAVPLAPYAARPDDRSFWTFTLWSGVGVVLAFLSVLLFLLGVSAILEMVRFLLSVGLGSDAYEHMYTTALTLVGPLIALGRIPADFEESVDASGEDRMAGGVRLLFDWVAAPLVAATAIVLHLYAAKILLIGELPRNEVGWIVISFLLLVLSLRIAADPFLSTGRLFARLFARVWAMQLVVPLGLLWIAILQRVGPEGWTPERYYLALGALAGVLVVVVQIVPAARGRIRVMAAIPVALLALSAAGPLGVGDTVGRSQAARLGALVRLEGDAVSVEAGRAAEARSRIEALAEVDALDRAVALLPVSKRDAVRSEIDAASAPDDEGSASAQSIALVTDAFGVTLTAAKSAPSALRVFASALQPPLDLAGFDVALSDRTMPPGALDPTETVRAGLDGSDLVVEVGATRERFALRFVVQAVPEAAFLTEASATVPVDVTLEGASERLLRLRVQRLSLDGGGRVTDLAGTLLLRRADWPGVALFGGGAETGSAEPGGAVGESPR